MNSNPRKHQDTSQHTSFIEYENHLSEIPKSLKLIETKSAASSSEPTRNFYMKFYSILILSFSNNIIYMGLDLSLTTCLIISTTLLLLILLFSTMTILSEEHEFFSVLSKIFNRSSLIFLSATLIVLVDPGTIFSFIYPDIRSSITSLQTLILLAALSYKYLQCNFKTFSILFILGLLSFLLSIIQAIEKSSYLPTIYEFSLLFIYLVTGGIYSCSYQAKEKPVQTGPVTTGAEEILSNLDQILHKLQEIHDNEENTNNFNKIITQLQSVNKALRQTPNIYSANMSSALKDIDVQDKIFIEQACFESYVSSRRTSKLDFPLPKDRESVYGVSELLGILKNIGKDWNFNTFFISNCTNDFPLQVIGAYSIKRFGLDDAFQIPEGRLNAFLLELESGYYKNPYHNSIHAADVMCSTVFLLESSSLIDSITSLELLANLVSALAHDLGHPGKNNRFIVMSRDDIAITYNDISVLENMHSAKLFQIMKKSDNNILATLPDEKVSIIRKDIIDMILATDMGKHFELMGIFKAKYLSTEHHNFDDGEIRADLFKLIIKAADIGHAAKCIELHEKWCGLVVQEFYDQGDLEKKLGLPVSMYCDRETTEIGKSQSGFIKNIVFPLFSTLNIVLNSPAIDEKCVQQLLSNQQFWESYKSSSKRRSFLENEEKEKSAAKNEDINSSFK